MSQANPFELITSDPVRYNMFNIKSKLMMVLVSLIQQNNWTQAEAAKQLNVSQPRMSNLFNAKLDKFSIDTLMEMLVGVGYKVDLDFDPRNEAVPLEMYVKKAVL